jgi:hypothetical protein
VFWRILPARSAGRPSKPRKTSPGHSNALTILRARIAGAERDAAELDRAHAFAARAHREMTATNAIAMRATQMAAFRKHVAAREKHMAVALAHAGEIAKAFRQFQLESEAMISVLPSGTSFPTMAIGDLGLGGNLLGGCDKLLLSEMFRLGAVPDASGRVAVLSFAKPTIVTQRGQPDRIPPGLEVLQQGHDALLREIEGQVQRLDEQLMRRASAKAEGVAA